MEKLGEIMEKWNMSWEIDADNMSWNMWKLMRKNDWTNDDGMGRSVMENVSWIFLDIIGMSCWTERSYSVQAIGDVMSQISTAWLIHRGLFLST